MFQTSGLTNCQESSSELCTKAKTWHWLSVLRWLLTCFICGACRPYTLFKTVKKLKIALNMNEISCDRVVMHVNGLIWYPGNYPQYEWLMMSSMGFLRWGKHQQTNHLLLLLLSQLLHRFLPISSDAAICKKHICRAITERKSS